MDLFAIASRSVLNVGLAASLTTPMGWMTLASRAMFSSVGQQALQTLGTQLGLPQTAIDLAQARFATVIGDTSGSLQNIREAAAGLASQHNLSPAEQGLLERAGTDMTNKLTSMLLDRVRDSGNEETKSVAAGGKGGSLLMKIAVAMGELMDQKMSDMAKLTDDIGNLGSIDNKNQAKLGELTGKLQGLGQEVNLLSNAMTNTIKSIGEANTTIARKG